MLLLTGVYGKSKSKISVGGNLEARFLSDCTVHCGGNIEVADQIAHCAVECLGSIHLGKNGGKGQGYGGRLVAMRGIQARILGSVSETATQVELAPPRDLLLRLVKTEEQIDATKKSLEIIEKNLQSSGDAPPDEDDSRTKDLVKKADGLREKLAALKNDQEILQEQTDAARKGRIKASEAHRGVTLRIGKTREAISDLTNDLLFLERIEEKPQQ
jgi:uncharacterized protein (DUF342 family)